MITAIFGLQPIELVTLLALGYVFFRRNLAEIAWNTRRSIESFRDDDQERRDPPGPVAIA